MPTPLGDGGGARRARALAALLALGCLAWLPYRAGLVNVGAAAPIFETLFTLVFVASAVFLAGGLGGAGRQRAAAWAAGRLVLAPLLLAMYARRWWPQADLLYYAIPALAAGVLAAQARLHWQVLRVSPQAA